MKAIHLDIVGYRTSLSSCKRSVKSTTKLHAQKKTLCKNCKNPNCTSKTLDKM